MAAARKEFPYGDHPRVLKVKQNLVDNFGYGKIEARELAREIIANLNTYDRLEKLRLSSIKRANGVYDNHTNKPPREKTILEKRMEARGSNLRIQVREV